MIGSRSLTLSLLASLLAAATLLLGGTARAQAPAAPPAAPPPQPAATAPGPAAQAQLAPSTGANAAVIALEDAEKLAREHQPQILEAHAQAQAADARVGESRAGLLPQISASLGYQLTTANVAQRPGVAASPSNVSNSFTLYNSFAGSLGATQLLWDFRQTSSRYAAAKALARSSAESEKAQLLVILLNVRAAFFSAQASWALAQVARQTETNQQKHLAQVEGFVQAGTQPDIALAQTRTDSANAQVARVNAENAYETAKQQLNVAMGLVRDTAYDVAGQTEPPVAGEAGELQPLIDEAWKARPEMLALQESVNAQQEIIRSTRGAYGPTLAASAGLTQAGEALDNLAWNGFVGLSLSWNLFQGGLTTATEREARANLANDLALAEAQRQQIASDVNSARLAVRAALSSHEAAATAQKNAHELLRLAEGRYAVGLGSIIELGDAQVADSSAAAQIIQSDFNLAAARAQLLKALGRP